MDKHIHARVHLYFDFNLHRDRQLAGTSK